MQIFNSSLPSSGASQENEDFWPIYLDTTLKKNRQEPLLIDIVMPQPRSQISFYNRTSTKPLKHNSAQRVSRRRIPKNGKQ